MQVAATAFDAAGDCLERIQADTDIFWLRSRGVAGLRRRTGASRASRVRGLVASASIGLTINLACAGTAFGPSAAARADVVANALGGHIFGAIAPVVAAPIPIPPAVAPLPGRMRPAAIDRNAIRDGLLAAVRDPDEILAFDEMRIPRWLVATILRACEATGVDPVYMMALADKESSFATAVKAPTSSAEGLFQFIVGTWLEVVREHGPRHGLAAEAAAIELVDGEPQVADEAMRQHILALRRDPYISAVMAAEMLKKDRAEIAERIGRSLDHTEYYLAHFFGAEGAGRFMEVLDEKPKRRASRVFPEAARANRPLFYARKGRKRKGLTVAEVYERIDRMIETRLDRYRDVRTVIAGPATAAAPAL